MHRSRDAYVEMLASLYPRGTGRFDLTLDRMHAVLAALGNPHRHKNTIIVAGTNGKGSTARFIEAGLRAAGKSTGLYTSPHLLRFTERVRIDGVEWERTEAVARFDELVAAVGDVDALPTFFECATAMAMLSFQDHTVDWRILEVGLGGRLDATNTSHRSVSVITPVGLDHTMYLGDTIAEIAGEKAGIISGGVPTVIAPQPAEAEAVLRQVATTRSSELLRPDPVSIPDTLPDFQRQNLATAAQAIATALGTKPTPTMLTAMAATPHPGRFQAIGDDILLDGAHNKAATRTLIAALRASPKYRDRPVHAVLTCLDDKDAQTLFELWGAMAEVVHVCPCSSGRSRTVEELKSLASRLPIDNHAHASLEGALQGARVGNALTVVTGSLFLVADAMALLTGAERDPPVDG